MGDNACVRHHCARVSACYGEEPSLVEVAQERATTTSFTCGPCVRRCSPNACVHASPTTADFSPTSYTRSKIKKNSFTSNHANSYRQFHPRRPEYANNKISSISIRSVFSFFRDLYFRETSESSRCATLDSLYVIDSDLYIHL